MYQNSELCYKHDPHNTLSEKIEKVFNYPKTEFPVNHPFVSKNVTINNVKTPGLATKIDLSVDKQYELTNNILSLSEYSEKGKNILLKANLITLLKNENFTDISFNLVYHDELEKRFFFYDSGLIYLEDYVNLIHFTPVAKSIQLIDLSSDKSCNLIVKNYVANSNLKTYLTNTNTLKNLDQDSLSKPNSKDIIEIINSEVLNSEQASSNLLNFKSKTLLIIACSLVFITIFLVVIFKNNPIKRKYKNLNDFDEEMR